MKRKLIHVMSVFLTVSLGLMAPLLLLLHPTSALAAGEKWTFVDSNTIRGSEGDFGDPVTGVGPTDFKRSGDTFKATISKSAVADQKVTIANIKKASGGGYTATVTSDTGLVIFSLKGPTNITITDPNGTGPDGGNKSSSSGGGSGATEEADCDAGAGFTWLICGVIHMALDAIDWIRSNVLVPFLQERPISVTGSDTYSKALLDVWSAFRNVANVLFILIFFMVIFGTAVGFDSYTIKKMLPRLIAATVLVQLSFLISSLVIDIGNVLGQGLATLLGGIIPTPKFDFTQTWSSKGIFLGGALLGVAGGVTAIVTLSFSSIVSLLLGMLALFFTLVLRKILIVLMVVLSPFAFVLWVLPNTEKWFKEWRETLIKLVLMYPFIILLLEAGRLFAKAAELAGTDGSGLDASLAPIFVLAGYAIPLLLAPATFFLAGRGMKAGANGIKKLSGKLNGQWGTGSDAAKRRAQNRQLKGAMGARGQPVTALGRGMQRIGLGGVQRRMAIKRGGFGGFVTGANASQRQQIESLAEKYVDDQAKTQAQREFRSQPGNQQTANEAIAARSNVLQAKMLEQRVAEASYQRVAGEGSSAIRQVDLNPEGIQQLSAAIREALSRGDQATAIAGMQRLAMSQGGQQELHNLRTSVMGGTDTQLVSEEHKTAWEMGTANAKADDLRKPPASAYSDISAEEFAGMSSKQTQRALDYYARSGNTAARDDFVAAAQEAANSNTLVGKIQPETRKVMDQYLAANGHQPLAGGNAQPTPTPTPATDWSADDARVNSVLNGYADQVAATGAARPTNDELADRMVNDPVFRSQVGAAVMNNMPLHNVPGAPGHVPTPPPPAAPATPPPPLPPGAAGGRTFGDQPGPGGLYLPNLADPDVEEATDDPHDPRALS